MRLIVRPLKQKDAGRGLAAIYSATAKELGLETGDFVAIIGKNGHAVARIWPAYAEDEGRGLGQVDGPPRQPANAGIDDHDELADLVARANDAVNGGLLGVDRMESPGGYSVIGVNHSVEFNALNESTDVDVPAKVVDWLESKVSPAVEIPA